MTAAAPGIGPTASAPASNAGQTPAEGGPMDVSGGNSGSSSNVPDVPGYVNVTPYQWAITLAKMIMLIATVLAGFIAICKAIPLAGLLGQNLIADPANEDASKKKYEEQYGVNPDTNQVDDANKANFDTKNGKGAADNWNKTHKKFST